MVQASPKVQEIVLIAGPTASGKSALALAWARERDAVVVNADSMQVYRDLRVITARPSEEEEALAEHALYGHVDGAVNHSVGRYLDDAAALLGRLDRDRRPVVFVGGTGLYFKALTEGLSELPPVPDEVRHAVRRDADGVPTPALHGILAARDPETAATLRPSDRLRVMRALEMHAATGRPLVRLRSERRPGPLADRQARKLFLAPDRDALRRRIDERFRAMIDAGALDEVAALARRGLDTMLPIMRAHGVPALIRHLRGEMTLPEAIAVGQGDTRRYAKRQFTWFRHQLDGWSWIDPQDAWSSDLKVIMT